MNRKVVRFIRSSSRQGTLSSLATVVQMPTPTYANGGGVGLAVSCTVLYTARRNDPCSSPVSRHRKAQESPFETRSFARDKTNIYEHLWKHAHPARAKENTAGRRGPHAQQPKVEEEHLRRRDCTRTRTPRTWRFVSFASLRGKIRPSCRIGSIKNCLVS